MGLASKDVSVRKFIRASDEIASGFKPSAWRPFQENDRPGLEFREFGLTAWAPVLVYFCILALFDVGMRHIQLGHVHECDINSKNSDVGCWTHWTHIHLWKLFLVDSILAHVLQGIPGFVRCCLLWKSFNEGESMQQTHFLQFASVAEWAHMGR